MNPTDTYRAHMADLAWRAQHRDQQAMDDYLAIRRAEAMGYVAGAEPYTPALIAGAVGVPTLPEGDLDFCGCGQEGKQGQLCPLCRKEAAALLVQSDDAEALDLLDSLLAIRSQISRARRFGLTLTTDTLRHKAMSLAECFVDSAWADEAREQLTADQARLSPGASARAIDETCGF